LENITIVKRESPQIKNKLEKDYSNGNFSSEPPKNAKKLQISPQIIAIL
jgi:hypothetical protein